ncbi:transglutaminase domain-containing protein, partial [candidate division KSB1 bacterium]|nr:transglutaminase domain-containing protein [candidate division KSB1 bacterium]
MKSRITFILIVFLVITSIAQIPQKFQRLIDHGEYSIAQKLMRMEIASNRDLSPEMRQDISFEIERLNRIKKDFTRSREYIIDYIKQYIPNVSDADIAKWEREKSLEYKIIDGEKRYFKWAGPNLFRIDKEAKKKKAEVDSKKPPQPDPFDLDAHISEVVTSARQSDKSLLEPRRFRITYTLSVDENAIPAGKILRCWLPYPREVGERQTDVTYISSNPERHLIADNDAFLQRSIYLEKPVVAGERTEFRVVFEYTGHGVFHKIDPQQVTSPVITDDLKPFIIERPPHIVFSSELRSLSEKIVGKQKNHYRIAQKIFKWVDDNIPWASAREYSTFKNVSEYVLENRHADCGMQTIFFMTLCRMNGIPTRWQSGWVTEPGESGM